jgi:flagellar hook-associated protein 1 FlgK
VTFNLLNISSSAVFVAQRATEVIGQNVSNSGTDGYTRQRLETTAGVPTPGVPGMRGTGMLGTGVVATNITRIRDDLSDLAYRTQAAANGSATAQSSVLDRAQQIMGPIDTGTPTSLNDFWNSWNTLSVSPADPAARSGVIDAGNTVAAGIRDAATQLDQITADTVLKIGTDVTTVNTLLTHVAQLNKQVLEATAAGSSPNDLLDERDRALDSLSSMTGATFRKDSLGSVTVSVGSIPLVQGENAATLTAGTSAAGTPIVTLQNDSTPLSMSGELGGYVAVTTLTIPALRGQLDTVAQGLISTVNAAHQAGYDASGAPGIAFFTGSGAANITVNPQLTAAKVAAAKGDSSSGSLVVNSNDGNNALAMSQLRGAKTVGSPGITVSDALNAFASQLGSDAAAAATSVTATSASLSGATKQRASADGVSVDEEMVDMLKWQRTYEAAAKCVSIADAMLDKIINGMGAGH